MRLICFPCAGSGGSFFSAWRGLLPTGVQLHPITLPGRLERIAEPPFTSFDQAVCALADELAPDRGTDDIFFGHSLGAILAFEVARRQRHVGLPEPNLVVVAGSVTPLALDTTAIARRSRASDEELLDEIRATQPDRAEILVAHSELRTLSLDAWRADLRLAATYQVMQTGQLNCPIAALSGTLDATAPPSSMADWRSQTTGEFRERAYLGGHMFVQDATQQIVAAIASWAPHHGQDS